MYLLQTFATEVSSHRDGSRYRKDIEPYIILLLDANFYSILYYNAVIWLTPNISCDAKHDLLSISSNALRSCLMYDGFNISFEKIHNQKCTPSQIILYQIAINLYKAINFEKCPTFEQINLLEQIVCGSRQLKFEIVMLLML